MAASSAVTEAAAAAAAITWLTSAGTAVEFTVLVVKSWSSAVPMIPVVAESIANLNKEKQKLFVGAGTIFIYYF